jgi:hypothetical protein
MQKPEILVQSQTILLKLYFTHTKVYFVLWQSFHTTSFRSQAPR